MSKGNVTPDIVFFRGVQTRADYLSKKFPFTPAIHSSKRFRPF